MARAEKPLIQIGDERAAPPPEPPIEELEQHIVEFVSDAGEGAQTAGQLFGTVSARMGNGVWTVEIIPAEIEPPRRSRSGASGNRVRVASRQVTNMGEAADVVVKVKEPQPSEFGFLKARGAELTLFTFLQLWRLG